MIPIKTVGRPTETKKCYHNIPADKGRCLKRHTPSAPSDTVLTYQTLESVPYLPYRQNDHSQQDESLQPDIDFQVKFSDKNLFFYHMFKS